MTDSIGDGMGDGMSYDAIQFRKQRLKLLLNQAEETDQIAFIDAEIEKLNMQNIGDDGL